MPDSFFFPVYSGLLTKEHKDRIGPALWEFLWCISATTKEVEQDGKLLGIVLGGKPVSYSEVAKSIGGSKSTVKRNFERLEQHGYITMKRTPYGHIIHVTNSKKFIKGAKNGTGAENDHWSAKNGTQGAKNGHSNKDIKDIKDIKIKDDDHNLRKNCFLEYEKTFGFPPAILQSDFNYWIDSSESNFVEPEEIIIEVIRRAKKQMPRNPAKYISRILKNLHDMELYTLEAVKEYNNKFDERAKGGGSYGAKIPQYGGGSGRPATKTLEQVLREADEAKRVWGG